MEKANNKEWSFDPASAAIGLGSAGLSYGIYRAIRWAFFGEPKKVETPAVATATVAALPTTAGAPPAGATVAVAAAK